MHPWEGVIPMMSTFPTTALPFTTVLGEGRSTSVANNGNGTVTVEVRIGSSVTSLALTLPEVNAIYRVAQGN